MTNSRSKTKRPPVGAAQVAERFKVSRSSVTRWVTEGRLVPLVRMPGKRGAYLFDPDEVDRLADVLDTEEAQVIRRRIPRQKSA